MASKVQENQIREWRAMGWAVVKLISTNKNGIPDLMCLKNGVAVFVECKEKGDTVKPLQVKRMKELLALGFDCFVNDTHFTLWLKERSDG